MRQVREQRLRAYLMCYCLCVVEANRKNPKHNTFVSVSDLSRTRAETFFFYSFIDTLFSYRRRYYL